MVERDSGRDPERFARDMAAALRSRLARGDGVRIASKINRSPGYVSERINGNEPWTLDELDAIAELIGTDGLTLLADLVAQQRGDGDPGDESGTPAEPTPIGPRGPGVPGDTVADEPEQIAAHDSEGTIEAEQEADDFA